MGISTFSHPVTNLTYPAITICKENGFYDPGEYVSAIFNQFQYVCQTGNETCDETALLKEQYREYVGVSDEENLSVFPKSWILF